MSEKIQFIGLINIRNCEHVNLLYAIKMTRENTRSLIQYFSTNDIFPGI